VRLPVQDSTILVAAYAPSPRCLDSSCGLHLHFRARSSPIRTTHWCPSGLNAFERRRLQARANSPLIRNQFCRDFRVNAYTRATTLFNVPGRAAQASTRTPNKTGCPPRPRISPPLPPLPPLPPHAFPVPFSCRLHFPFHFPLHLTVRPRSHVEARTPAPSSSRKSQALFCRATPISRLRELHSDVRLTRRLQPLISAAFMTSATAAAYSLRIVIRSSTSESF